jgi:membrane protein DedA with SNARE-associated domain
MSTKTMAALAWSSVLAALGCIAAGLPLAKRGFAVGWPLVVASVVLIAMAIVLAVVLHLRERRRED